MEYKELRRRYENIFFEGRKDIEYNEEWTYKEWIEIRIVFNWSPQKKREIKQKHSGEREEEGGWKRKQKQWKRTSSLLVKQKTKLSLINIK
jgi:hypothetical protein